MSHCYGYNSYSELLDAARKEREEKARQLEMAELKYRICEREDECFKLQKHVRKLEQQRNWLINELCVGTQCDFPSQIECKYRSERGYYCPEQKEKFKCWVAHAEQATKE